MSAKTKTDDEPQDEPQDAPETADDGETPETPSLPAWGEGGLS